MSTEHNYSPVSFGTSRRRRPRWGTFLKQFALGLLALIVLLYLVSTVIYYFFTPQPPNPLAPVAKPLNIAHQGGELLAPTDTIAAFDVADSLNVDVLELDIHMTKDGEIVVMHDATVDRTTDGKGRTDSYTLADLQKLDAGYTFKDLNGQTSYRGKGVYIPALKEVFQRYGTHYHYNIEIKGVYPLIEEKLFAMLKQFGVEKQTVVTSFDDEAIARFDRVTGGTVALGAGRSEVTRFVVLAKAFLPGLFRPQASVLQIPVSSSGINLKDELLIKVAHRFGIQVHYWTIDDSATMKELLDLGADGIITNRPDLLKQLLDSRATAAK
ncbi:glycerophosphodiester phosphodiesterase [Paenibacillus koleovorans]|uniref:glycerophosphodiester phosphodiesterase n=1 Tax=Paenibacillus koleovorans TaxID=121608 RepID=UPI000FDB93F0|nr:glycerophosphodiester phosphodiesterase [Paenibacillus koleovorans]